MIKAAARIILEAKRVCAFTGAGISVESGIPPFRGPGGLWNQYNPEFIEISYFHQYREPSWRLIKEVFYDFFGKARPNAAHFALASLEKMGIVKAIITQNIDNLHQEAGSQTVYEFHGTAHRLICLDCQESFPVSAINLNRLPPECPNCIIGRIKPDFIFFGEGIPEPARTLSFAEAEKSDVFIVIGTTGEVMPACMIPHVAHENGARIIEINTCPSAFTSGTTDIFLQGKATTMMQSLLDEINAQQA
ncbi:MAG TPA: NAD-dependent deacylase [Candidatus Rifleibacterium sp.]|nr:NAD-dependent deacylase [Candidatus Rifleibacterium sp.]HPT47718.1 NAD-dependent deacylase [Candidatus Rifleibacterium sp.]